MANIENNIWESDGKQTPVGEMSNEQLQQAFLLTCLREFKNFTKANEFLKTIDTMQALKSMLQREAERRDVNLLYPDQTVTSKMSHYFSEERRIKEGKFKAVLSTGREGS